MQIGEARALVDAYAATAETIRASTAELSPLVTKAHALLDGPGQHPVHGPMPALATVSSDLSADERDLQWRVDWLESTDTLAASAEAAGLTDQIRDLLHIDSQSGWTPWHDGDAEVTPEEAFEVAQLLSSVDPVVASLVLGELSEEELERLGSGLDGNATHADKPWGHWAWSPLQVPARETKTWVYDEAAAAASEYMAGITTGFAGMATQQGGPSQFNPYPASQTEQHFRNAHDIVLDGSIPLVSNAARCADGDGWSCVGLGAEVVVWAGAQLLGGVIIGVIGRVGAVTIARVRLRNGTERVVSIVDGSNASRPAANRATYNQLISELRSSMERPFVDDPTLDGWFREMWRPNAQIGNGSTAAAVRYELANPGASVGGRTHIQKAEGYVIALKRWLRTNPTASIRDRAAAENVLADLVSALEGN